MDNDQIALHTDSIIRHKPIIFLIEYLVFSVNSPTSYGFSNMSFQPDIC